MLGSLLPSASGLLPTWNLLIASAALFNSIQNLFGTKLTKEIYALKNEQVTDLQARTFAIWTFVSAIVRLYGAYHIQEKAVYELTMWTYAAALLHFGSEWLIFRSVKFNRGSMWPLLIAPIGLVWMATQYKHYVRI